MFINQEKFISKISSFQPRANYQFKNRWSIKVHSATVYSYRAWFRKQFHIKERHMDVFTLIYSYNMKHNIVKTIPIYRKVKLLPFRNRQDWSFPVLKGNLVKFETIFITILDSILWKVPAYPAPHFYWLSNKVISIVSIFLATIPRNRKRSDCSKSILLLG